MEWSRVEQSGLNIIEQWESGRDQNSEELITHSLTHSQQDLTDSHRTRREINAEPVKMKPPYS